MFCSRCGNKLKDDSVFCSECGMKIVNSEERKIENVQEVNKKESTIKVENEEEKLSIIELKEKIKKSDDQIQYLYKEIISLQVKYKEQTKRQEKMEKVILDIAESLKAAVEVKK